jgi:hypothetical protein
MRYGSVGMCGEVTTIGNERRYRCQHLDLRHKAVDGGDSAEALP